MGTRAHWFNARWRYRLWDGEDWGSPVYADLLADIRTDAAGKRAKIERRVGNSVQGYRYLDYGVLSDTGTITKDARI